MPIKKRYVIRPKTTSSNNNEIVHKDTIKVNSVNVTPKSNYEAIPNKEMQRKERMKHRNEPFIINAGFTTRRRAYKNGGKE